MVQPTDLSHLCRIQHVRPPCRPEPRAVIRRMHSLAGAHPTEMLAHQCLHLLHPLKPSNVVEGQHLGEASREACLRLQMWICHVHQIDLAAAVEG
eukprot:CAMPEP_0181224104 /NCGR_PEP_ID=MMETSP1096-20121128/30930_1 /TAXON_ID=156174 ORGANISM="Chrysochromulina ericina, Strain CCMP281" /NCGR_SAMPLE_ID=MMETSP1096 /ASSEMBLY_ACC=CAM_ASM_000453 /LENGTH=94 /DNA_ID=CAMNT_0023317127 /DNA_START=71 /DNA_END=355 /DNA_ORIENTATION=-